MTLLQSGALLMAQTHTLFQSNQRGFISFHPMKSINDIEIAGLKLLKLLVYSMFYNVYGYKNDL